MKRLILIIIAITAIMLITGCGKSKQKASNSSKLDIESVSQDSAKIAELESLVESLKSNESFTDKKQLENLESLITDLKNNELQTSNIQLEGAEDLLKSLDTQSLGLGNLFSISSFKDIKKAYGAIMSLFGSNDEDLMSSLKSSLNAISKADSIMNASTNTFSDINERMNKADNKKPSTNEGK